jgi:GNAT superfamily N-acetyltransferase
VTPFRAVVATAEHGAALAELFARAEVPCYCRYWHFAGSANAWLDRSAHHADENREEMQSALNASNDEMSGVVALAEDAVIGWMKVAPAASLPKLYSQRLYRSLPCFSGSRAGVFTIGCILVDPAHRRSRVASGLLACAIDLARDRGGHSLEAFPRRADGVAAPELWTGPFSLYRDAGFEVVHDFAPYPVMRREL